MLEVAMSNAYIIYIEKQKIGITSLNYLHWNKN